MVSLHVSRGREVAHPDRHLAGWQEVLGAEACGGYSDLHRGDRGAGPVSRALCWSHARRKVRGVGLGRKSWLFAGSERGGDRAAFIYALIVTAKMNDIDPRAWLADVLARLPNITASQLPDLLPWNRKSRRQAA